MSTNSASVASQPDDSYLRANPNVGSSKSLVPSQGGPTVDSMTATIDLKAPNLGEISHFGSLDSMISTEGIGSQSVFKFADEAGKMFVGSIDTGSIAPALQHEFSEEKSGLGHLGANKQLGAEKGPSQGVVGHSQGG